MRFQVRAANEAKLKHSFLTLLIPPAADFGVLGTIEIATLEELIELARVHGALIIANSDSELALTVYNDYME